MGRCLNAWWQAQREQAELDALAASGKQQQDLDQALQAADEDTEEALETSQTGLSTVVLLL